MSSNPSSNSATQASTNDLPPHHAPPCNAPSSSSNAPPLQLYVASQQRATEYELSKTRVAIYLSNPTYPHPTYQHTTSAASMAVHERDMKARLEHFDDIFIQYSQKSMGLRPLHDLQT
ncbi:hypothetical protein BDZ45DRAFT_797800 [Acephala macrosclerotiorum]|nr:hypothetical protein BDZ45DRAFT_797800 [Acephala macrosclerotiorum]